MNVIFVALKVYLFKKKKTLFQVSSGLHPDNSESELKKILLQSKPECRKRKYEQINMPSTSGAISSPAFKVRF